MRRGCLTVCLLLVSGPAFAQTTQYRDKAGNPTYTERWEMGGKWLVTRDNRGNPQGYWVQSGGGWEHRDNAGNVIGRATTRP